MGLTELFLIAVALSMDAFAVSICKGLSMKKVTLKKCALVGVYFGGFQALMPLIGYLIGVQFESLIKAYDHWIALVLLAFIGAKMIKESFEKEPENEKCSADFSEEKSSVSFKKMFPLAIATSIDALAAGVTFAFINVDIVPAISFIGVITLLLSMVGVKVGNVFGTKYKARAEFVGGLILILMGTKIVLEHLEIL